MNSKKVSMLLIAGLFISGAVAAMMSTADSQLLVSTSAVTEDFFHQFLKKDLDEKTLVRLNRILIILLGTIAYGIALYSEYTGKNIFGVVSYAWSGLGSAFGPALVLTLWWKKTTRNGKANVYKDIHKNFYFLDKTLTSNSKYYSEKYHKFNPV